MIVFYRFVFYMNEIRYIVSLNAQLIHRVFTQCLARTLPSVSVRSPPLGLEEAPDHFNKNWKKGAKFYKADTRFAIEVERGYEIYPCQLIVAELKNGERYVYDLVEIKKPTLSASAGNANLSMTKRSTSTGESVASSESISQTGGAAQARFSVGGGGAVCHNNGHYQQRQAVSICTPFAKYWTLSLK